jgi:hypothetical protein
MPISPYFCETNSAVIMRMIVVTVTQIAMSRKDKGIVTLLPLCFCSAQLNFRLGAVIEDFPR